MTNYSLKKVSRGSYRFNNKDFDVRVNRQHLANVWHVEIQDLNNDDCLTDTHSETFNTKSDCVEFMNYYLNNTRYFIN